MSVTLPGPGWRQDVRDRVASILTARVPMVAGRVQRSWIWPVNNDVRPALLVYGYGETKTLRYLSNGVSSFDVTCQMVVKLRVAGRPVMREDGLVQEEDLENLARAVERSILEAPELIAPMKPVLIVDKVQTQLTVEQRGDDIEAEGTMIFDMRWEEEFAMAEPDTSECADVAVRIYAPSIPIS